MLTLGSLAIWKARKAVVNNCSNVLDRGTVIARNIRLRSEQLPSNTFIVSAKVRKKSASQYLSKMPFATFNNSLSYLHLDLPCLFPFSPYLCHICAPTHFVLLHFLHSCQIHLHEIVPHRRCSSRLICCELWNQWMLIRMFIAHVKDYIQNSDPKKSC